MKQAIKYGFGVAFGVYLFHLCNSVVNKVIEKSFQNKFDSDPVFRTRIKELSPELYVKYRKEYKEPTTTE